MQYVALAAFAGFFLPLQVLVNARTSEVFGSPLMAALVSFAGGTIILIAVLAFMRAPMPTAEQVARLPVYCWFAGAAGVIFISQASVTVPKLGAATMIGVVITGQLIAAMIFDHFGILQQPHPMSWHKIMGALLLIAGVWLMLRPGD